jgi:hypothetical protein
MKQVQKDRQQGAANSIVLVGIFHHPTKGLVLYQIKHGKNQGKLRIPGRKLKKVFDTRFSTERQFYERQTIATVFTEQTGRYCFARSAFHEFNSCSKSMRTFLIEIGDGDQIDDVEFLDDSFIYISADPNEIKSDQDILPDDKAILLYYLVHQEKIKNRKDSPFTSVTAIAS